MTPANMPAAAQTPAAGRRPHGRKAVRWVQLLIGLGAIFSCLPATLAANYVLVGAQRKLCPATAFMYGPTQLGHILMVIPWFFVALPVAMILANLIERAARQWTGRADETGFRSNTKGLLILLPWFVAPGLVISLLAMPSYYCASESGIRFKQAIWSPLLNYKWQDIRAVATECFHQGRQNRDAYQLIMSDGMTIDLADRREQFVAAYPRIDALLSPLTFDFSATSIDQCPNDLAPLFAHRP